ncbi:hypothetical protein DSL72_008884 [Monilinia vaccinii-corymbosi]|uniref:Uncharacterized protein n=1 Tax=Monilinia vaccinii-corymbosi TaxID=61207 RepID=A0A8A3PSE9_9HELO|nr:hypothetical protein DSL72_008884 [Monilinia vaccinii-corymbosi]
MLSYYPENEAATLKYVDLVLTKGPSSIGSMEVILDVEDDLEAYLEDFSRLTRKGKFNTAIQLFHACPLHLQDRPEFILDFLDTLLKQGAYKTLVDFNADKEQLLLNRLSECGTIPIYYLRSILELGRHHLFGFPESGLVKDVGADEVRSELLSNFEELDSIQVPLLRNLIQLDSEIEKFTKPPQNSQRKLVSIVDSSLNWHGLYRHLLSTNSIWDMRDLFHALCSRFGVGDTITLLFKTPKQAIPSAGLNLDDVNLRGWFHFVLDWTQCSHGDESTDLALLDVLVTMSLQLLLHGNENEEPIKKIITQAMAHANQFAISLSLSNSENVQASPF